MRALIACEFSGTVRDAFSRRGHDAWSCDLLPSDTPGKHFQEDVAAVLRFGPKWDLLIAHPPCTFLCNSGVRWLVVKGQIQEARNADMKRAADFFALLLSANVPRVCVENPIMHKHARNYLQETWRVTRHDATPTQRIQPWQFGHGETKATCLWLRGLPLLKPTNVVSGREQRVWKLPPSADRWKERSKTYSGVAEAMADQWGNL